MKNILRGRARTLSVLTMKFSALEVRRIEKAVVSCGCERDAAPSWARKILLGNVEAVLRERKARTPIRQQRRRVEDEHGHG